MIMYAAQESAQTVSLAKQSLFEYLMATKTSKIIYVLDIVRF